LALCAAILALSLGAVSVASAKPQAEVLTAAGGKVPQTVDKFRSKLGPDNGGAPGGKRKGRREINWDAVPDAFAAPNALPTDFFNAPAAPRARGALLTTPGDHVAVSADSDNPDGVAVRFGDLNPGYPSQFRTFSAERLFSPIGSNVVNLKFRVPGTGTPAVVRGFGAVYTDIDRRENTALSTSTRTASRWASSPLRSPTRASPSSASSSARRLSRGSRSNTAAASSAPTTAEATTPR
jgi:hypothetical protein